MSHKDLVGPLLFVRMFSSRETWISSVSDPHVFSEWSLEYVLRLAFQAQL